jgi:hypothetical protein
MRQSDDAENVDPRGCAGGDWPGLAPHAGAFYPHQQNAPAAAASFGRPGALKQQPPPAAMGAPAPPPPPPSSGLLAPRRRPALRDITLLMVPQAEAKDGAAKLPMPLLLHQGPGRSSGAAAAAAMPPPASLLPPRPPRAVMASMR